MKMNYLEKLQELTYAIGQEEELEENIEELKKVLKDEKENGLDLNNEITRLYLETGEEEFFEGNLTENWRELADKFSSGIPSHINTDCNGIYSLSVYEMMNDNDNKYIDDIINEIYPNFKPMDKYSKRLTLDDLLYTNGRVKITMFDDRYMVSEDEIEKFENWAEEFEDIEDEEKLQETYRIKSTDILTDEYVYLIVKAEDIEGYENHQDLDLLNIELVK